MSRSSKGFGSNQVPAVVHGILCSYTGSSVAKTKESGLLLGPEGGDKLRPPVSAMN